MNTADLKHPQQTATEPQEEIPIGAGIDFTDPNGPLASYYLQTSHVVAITLLVAVFILMNRMPLWHTDIWGHLAFGRWIVQQGNLPTNEPFCTDFSDKASPGLSANWLSQSVYYLVYATGAKIGEWSGATDAAGGVNTLRFFHAVLVVLKLLFLWLAFLRLTNSPGWSSVGLVVLILLSLGNLAIIRPQVMGEACVAALLFFLAAPVPSRRALILIPLVMVLWANAHGSFLMGLTLLGFTVAGRMIECAWQNREKPGFWKKLGFWKDDSCRRLLLCLSIAVTAIAVLNPSGPWIYTEALALARHPNVLAMDEWQPMRFSLGPGGHWAYAVTLFILLGALALRRRWFAPTPTLFLLFLVWQPWVHQRMFVWWFLVFLWIALPHYAAWGAEWAKGRTFGGVLSFRKTLVAGMVIFLGLMWSIPVQWAMAGQPIKLEQSLSSGTPLQFANIPRPGRIFASETLADYLVWRFPEPNKCCIYTHVHLFAPECWRQCQLVKSGQPGWDHVLGRWGVHYVIVEAETHPHLRQRLQQAKDWEIVLDETGDARKIDKRCRLLIAQRKFSRAP